MSDVLFLLLALGLLLGSLYWFRKERLLREKAARMAAAVATARHRPEHIRRAMAALQQEMDRAGTMFLVDFLPKGQHGPVTIGRITITRCVFLDGDAMMAVGFDSEDEANAALAEHLISDTGGEL